MCLSIFECVHMSAGTLGSQRHQIPGAGVIDSYGLPDMDARN